MKHFFAVIFVTLAAILEIHAQNADTTKVTIPSVPVPKMNDSILLKQDKTTTSDFVMPALREYKNIDKYDYTDNQVTFKVGRMTGKNILNSSYSKFIVPTVLISYGLIAQGSDKLKELDYSTLHEITEHYTGRIHLDDYTQFAPAVAVYALDFARIKAKHNFRDRTIIMATSHIIMCATVQTMKSFINIERPDGSNNNSFPSGHTATSFVGAHILFKEYKDTSPWIGVAGYAVAITTGTLRVVNKKHWISDVVTGAGIGILSAELGYLLLPVFHNMFDIKNSKNSLVVAPTIGVDNYGIGLAYRF